MDAILAFIGAFAGQRVHIPSNVTESSALTKVIGIDHARAIVKAIRGGAEISVPIGKRLSKFVRDEHIRALAREGKSTNQIVRETGVHESTVRRVRNRARPRVKRVAVRAHRSGA